MDYSNYSVKRGRQVLTPKQLTFENTVNGEIVTINGVEAVIAHVKTLGRVFMYLDIEGVTEGTEKLTDKKDEALWILNVEAPDEAFPDYISDGEEVYYKRKTLRLNGINIRSKFTWVTLDEIMAQGKLTKFLEWSAKSFHPDNEAA